MPLTRGEAIGYDADLMAFKFTMRNGEQIVQCQISNAALSNLAGRWRGAERPAPGSRWQAFFSQAIQPKIYVCISFVINSS
jgi:hypothetical protein